ncbi:MAG: DUF882 domain-containing protein [Beijerinckiaceae bacterium]
MKPSLKSIVALIMRPGRTATLALAGLVLTVAGVRPTQDAVANGGTRSLTIFHAHTKEQETITFKRSGSFDSAGLQKLNWLLRDWRQDEPTRMDPYLFDILWEVYRASGSGAPIHVVSAYRSPGTNAMLRRRSRGVAKSSQHMSGKAVDFNLPDVSMATVRDIGLRMQHGGVGYYPRANNPWVHLDTGGVRHWPKISRDHLVRLFPDERTVHIPRDGKPLAGFESARAVIESRGGSVSSGYIDIAEGRATGKTLFQILFGGGEEDDSAPAARGRGQRGRTAVASRQAAPAPFDADNGNTAMAFFQQQNATTTVAARSEPPARPLRPTRPTPLPEPQDKAPVPVETRQEPAKPEAPKQVEVAALAPRQVPQPAPTPAAAEDEGKRVTVELPPRRPANLTPAGPALALVQLPPRRPDDLLTASVGQVEKAGEPEKSEAPKPLALASLGRQVIVPLPPARPATLIAAVAPQPVKPVDASPIVTAYAPAQPLRPAIIPAAPAAAIQSPASPPQADRKALNSLLAQISVEAAGERGGRVAPASMGALAAPRALTGRFEEVKTAPETGRGFSGSAIRPLRSGFKAAE